jgi:signal transduction histidine kinase/ligand-binding sensor domain-containing protein
MRMAQLIRAALLLTILIGFCRQAAQAEIRTAEPAIKLPLIDARDIAFRHLTTKDGLSHSIVNRIVQDDQGFMWFGAQAGLNRYDGYRFRVYKHDHTNPNSLSGAYVRALFKDKSGLIWIGVDQFLDKFDPVTETFTHYRMRSTVVHISEDRSGILWISTSNGLVRFEPSTGHTITYRHNPADSSSLSSSDVWCSGEDSTGTFWVATTRGLDAFDRSSGKINNHVPINQPSDISFHEDRFGVLWVIYPYGSGLAVLNRKTNTLTPYLLYDDEPPSTAVAGVAAMLEDGDGTLWFGTHRNGLLKLGPNRQKFIRYRNNQSDPVSLAQDTQLALFEDREGLIWVTASGSGIDQFARNPLPFERFQHEPGNPNSLDMNKANGVYEDDRGIFWVGTESGLNRVDRKTGRYTFYRDGAQRNVVAITGDGSRYLWIGAYGSGLKRFDTTTGTFAVYLHNPDNSRSLSNNIVIRVFRDNAGTLWAATGDGLNRFNPATNDFTVYKVDPGNPSRQSYVCITEDQQGYLWLGTQNSGLQRFNPATGTFTVYEHDPAIATSLSNNRVLSLRSDHAGTLWVGTQNGLNRFDPKTRSFTAFYEREGLPDTSINAILENHNGDLWISTARGLSKFNPASKAFTNYSAADGLSGDEFGLFGAAFKSRTGEMYFGGPNGVTAFYPDRIVEKAVVPPMVLTDFRLFAQPVSIGSNSPLRRSIGYTNSIRLSYWQTIFSLEFSALSYGNSATNRYRYRLEGLEKEWNETTGNNRSVTYTTLPPGDYVFRAEGATSRGPWNQAGIALHIEVLPPWWSTWWFRLISAAAILVLLGRLYQLRLQQIANQFDVRLEERVTERTRIARDLHDNLLQSFHGLMMRFQLVQKMLPDRPAEAERALKIAMDRAAQAITEGRDAVQALRTNTSPSNDLVSALTALGEEMTATYAGSENGQLPSEFRFLVEGSPEPLHPIFQDELYRIAREAVGNAFRHARAKHVEVDVRFDARILQLRVRDDGIGMESSIAQGGRDGHWGLPGMRERAKNIGARFELWSETGAGTEIEVISRAAIAYRNGRGSGEKRETA